jgi:hypothetical protein
MPGHTADDLIQDYISDVWGKRAAPEKAIPERTSPETEVIASSVLPVEKARSLVPTLKFPFSASQCRLTPSEHVVLLNYALYFLRRPLSPSVRCCMLMSCDLLIDAFQASCWLREQAEMRVWHEV